MSDGHVQFFQQINGERYQLVGIFDSVNYSQPLSLEDVTR